MKKFYPFLLVVILSLFLRLIFLERIPIGVTDDVLGFLVDAKAIYYTGHDVTGKWTPLSLSPPPTSYSRPELISTVLAPFVGPFNLNLFTARLPSALAGTVLVVILYFTSLKLIDPLFAFIVGMTAAFNPALIILYRSGYDHPIACVLYFIAFYLILFKKGWKILLSLPFLFFGFYSYYGTRLNFIPFVLITCLYGWLVINKKKYTRQYFLVICFSILLTGFFFYSLRQRPGSRLGELLSFTHPEVVKTVNEERRLSVESPGVIIFSNKLVATIRIFIEKYLGIFSANLLFLYGESQQHFSLWKHGLFYYLDFIFLILGFAYLFNKNRKLCLFLALLVLIAPLPSGLSMVGTEYTFRSLLIYPPLVVIIGGGFYYLVETVKNKKYSKILIFFVGFLYLIQIINFFNIYFLRNPIYNSEGASFSYRVLSNYIRLAESENNRIFVLGEPLGHIEMHLFYSGKLNKENLLSLRQQVNKREFRLENVYFLSKCNRDLEFGNNDVILVSPDFECLPLEKYPSHLSISQLADGGEIYKIFNDSLCSQFILNPYPSQIKFSDFKVESLSPSRFCEKFISDLTGI